jgi:hypothetical protein
MTKTLRLATTSVFLTVLLAVPAFATTARAVSFDAKVSEADQIFMGKCVSRRSALDPSGRWILTYSTFRVQRSFKGASPAEMTVALPGGTVGSLHQETVGTPSFRPGDERILFVSQSKAGPSVLYFDQGTYAVHDSDGVTMVQPVASSLVLIDPQTGTAHGANEKAQSVDAFASRVRDVVSHTRNREVNNGFSMATEHTAESAPGFLSALQHFLHANGIWIAVVAVGIVLAAIPLLRR